MSAKTTHRPRIRVGSHADVARLLAPAGEAGLAHLELDGVGADRDVVLATGAAGTVYLCHAFLIHAAQIHRALQRAANCDLDRRISSIRAV
jgi:hypothetical protein